MTRPTAASDGLAPAPAERTVLAPDDHAARLLHTRLVRRRNRVVFGLHTAADALETALAERR